MAVEIDVSEVYEVRWHARAGQGAKTASQFLTEAVIEAGKFSQSIPEFGSERTGAPMKAYNRISDEPILIKTSVQHPNMVIVLDPSLLYVENVLEGIRENGVLVVNTDMSPTEIREKLNIPKNIKVFTVNATKIAYETLGRNLPNVPLLGAIARITNIIDINTVKKSIEAKFLKKLGEEGVKKNFEALERGYNEVKEG